MPNWPKSMEAAGCGVAERSTALGSDCKFKILMRPMEQSMPQMMVLFTTGDNNAPPKLDSLLSWSVRAYTELGNRNDSGAADPYMVTKTLAKAAEKNGATVALDLPPVRICRRQAARQVSRVLREQ